MATYIAVTALSIPFNADDPNNTYIAKPGDEVEFDGEVADEMLRQGAIREPDEDDDAEFVGDDEFDEDDERPAAELPERPSTSASREVWRGYLVSLGTATRDLGELPVPEDAKRDDLVRLGDERVAQWNTRNAAK